MSKTRSKPTVARYRGAKSKSVRIVILLMSDGFATGPPQGGRPCEAGPCGPAGCRSRKSRRDVKVSPCQKNAACLLKPAAVCGRRPYGPASAGGLGQRLVLNQVMAGVAARMRRRQMPIGELPNQL